MLYAALGDSITYGYCATHDDLHYVSRVQRSLAKQQPASLYLLARPGWTSRRLLKQVQAAPPCIWEEARLTSIMIGGNDILHATPWLLDGNAGRMMKVADKLRANLTEIVHTVRRPQSTIVVATLYNPFPNSMLCEEFSDLLNKSIRLVAQRENVALADVRQHFFRHEDQYVDGYRRGQIRDFRIFGNPIHPNDAGHEAISEVVLTAFRRSTGTSRPIRRRETGVRGVSGVRRRQG